MLFIVARGCTRTKRVRWGVDGRRAMCHVITLLAQLAGLHSGVLGLSEYTSLAPGLGDVPIAGGKLQYLLRTIW